MTRRAVLLAVLLAPWAVEAGADDLFVVWQNAAEALDVGLPYTAAFVVTDARGDAVPQAILRLTPPDGSRVPFQELVSNDEGVTYASLVQDRAGVFTYRLDVTGRLTDAGEEAAGGPPLVFTVNVTRGIVVAWGDPLFLLPGAQATLRMTATWAHDGALVRVPDPSAPSALRFAVAERDDPVIGLKQSDGNGAAAIPFTENATALRLFEVGASNLPGGVAGVQTAKTFIAWVDDETLVPETVHGCVAHAGAGVIVLIRIDTALNEHWVPLDHRVETDPQGCFRVETQFVRGDTILAAVVGAHRYVTAPDGHEVRIDLAPAAPPRPGEDPDLTGLSPPPPQGSPLLWIVVGSVGLLLAAASVLWLRRRTRKEE
jgi:hypothetical protein